jgi:hypothetical protein
LGRVQQETNVRVPDCAAAALDSVADHRRVSRDEAVRQILGAYLTEQLERDPDDRLTHISTVLRYPTAPRGRRLPRQGRLVRLRLAPGTADRLRAVALRLPGQAQRGHRDYQARLLTDAVVTAIAMREPFSDEFLDGLLPLLRQRAALGLWQLAMAVTTTEPELALHRAAEQIRASLTGPGTRPSPRQRRLLLADEALGDTVAWHSSVRFVVVANLARDRLSGPDARQYENVLYEQANQWHEELLDLRELLDRSWYLRGMAYRSDASGRGAGAAWRAERGVAGQDFQQWLMARRVPHAPAEYHVEPPGWWVNSPADWCSRTLPTGDALPEPFAAWRATGQLLVFPALGRQMLWPVTPITAPPCWAPVPGIEPVIAAASRLKPGQLSSFVEAVLLDRDRTAEDEGSLMGLTPAVRVPADKAVEFGLIDDPTRHEVMAQARAATLRTMTDIIDALPDGEQHQRATLESVHGNSRLFSRITSRLGIPFHDVPATWAWPVRSVAEAIDAGLPAAAITWLAGYVYDDSRRTLQRVTKEVWDAAFR